MKLPNADRAFVDIAKLRDYSLNAEHKEGKHKARVFVIRLPSRSLGEGWCFVIRLSSMVVSELPKTATGKVQNYVFRGKPAISKQ